MDKDMLKFVRKIYCFCDENINQEFLFPFFTNFYPEKRDFSKTELTKLTSKIISRLIKKGVLEGIPRDSNFHTPYGMYKVLEHDPLTFRGEEFIKDPYNFDFTKEK